jgi:hypothetical protein
MVAQGRGTPSNPRLAAAIFEGLACLNHPKAAYALGYMYYYGLGLPRDLEKAYLWINKSTLVTDEDGHPVDFATEDAGTIADQLSDFQLDAIDIEDRYLDLYDYF